MKKGGDATDFLSISVTPNFLLTPVGQLLGNYVWGGGGGVCQQIKKKKHLYAKYYILAMRDHGEALSKMVVLWGKKNIPQL